MSIDEKNGNATILLEGRIDSNNAGETEKELLQFFESNKDMANTLGLSERAREHAPAMLPVFRSRLFPNAENLCRLFAMRD